MKAIVYGGQYGSEGKASVAEYLAKGVEGELAVYGEPGPNSGHTNSLVKTRCLPATAVYANFCMIGPDAVIDPQVLVDDIWSVYKARDGKPKLETVVIHQHAAVVKSGDRSMETALVERIGSTGTGSAAARYHKYCLREQNAVIGNCDKDQEYIQDQTKQTGITIAFANRIAWPLYQEDCANIIIECSQGIMLDVNMGIYPFVTSRTTNPIETLCRLGMTNQIQDFNKVGVFRANPIRTGGNSGPCYGDEIQPIVEEQASVTGRIRRMFNFNIEEFRYSMRMVRPNIVVFTHMDYQGVETNIDFIDWATRNSVVAYINRTKHLEREMMLYWSREPGKFNLPRI